MFDTTHAVVCDGDHAWQDVAVELETAVARRAPNN
jgi:hypothetical protein